MASFMTGTEGGDKYSILAVQFYYFSYMDTEYNIIRKRKCLNFEATPHESEILKGLTDIRKGFNILLV